MPASIVEEVMTRRFGALSPSDPLSRAIDLIRSGYQQDFPVIRDGRMVGLLCLEDLLAGLAKVGSTAPVRWIMRETYHTVSPLESLARLQGLRHDGGQRDFPVIEGHHVVGILPVHSLLGQGSTPAETDPERSSCSSLLTPSPFSIRRTECHGRARSEARLESVHLEIRSKRGRRNGSTFVRVRGQDPPEAPDGETRAPAPPERFSIPVHPGSLRP